MSQNLVFTKDVALALDAILDAKPHNHLAVIVDENTARVVLPEIRSRHLAEAQIITIGVGDSCKNLDTLTHVWNSLEQGGATRKSVVVNLGGGVVTDLGGFAAATFKRGISFVNIPTTLLSAVDAAVGGKTGINFGGLKNEIGCFQEASDVIISTRFLATLPIIELKSGYAEMLKHGMLSSHDEFIKLINYDFQNADAEHLLQLLKTSVLVKERIVKEDPHEQGIRRALNLGHTVGHAFESKALHDGKLTIPDSLWFIGTANNDDSTFTITDKVYDRAIPIELNERADAFECEPHERVHVTADHLQYLFQKAKVEYVIDDELLQKMHKLDQYLQTRFKLAFGNRIIKQMYDFIPVYVACGGTELGGMDYIIARKVLKKFESMNVSFVRDEMKGLIEYIEKTFGEGGLPDSVMYLQRIQNFY